jgi:pimeloyl-ACP methyl ester carboxylesterase
MVSAAIESGHAPVGGLQLYYEIRGSGEPLMALHGGIGSMEMFGPNLERLAADRRLISVDLQGHGRTGDIDRPLTYEAMADDIAGLLDHLDLGQADVLGYSLGGGVAMATAVRHRPRVRRLVLASIAMRRRDYFPEILAGFDALGPAAAPAMNRSRFHAHYAAVSPRPDFAGLLGKVGALIQTDYDWTPRIAGLPPTLLVVGDADAMRLPSVIEAFALLGGGQRDPGWNGAAGRTPSQLAILPGISHYDMAASPALAAAVEGFLAARR